MLLTLLSISLSIVATALLLPCLMLLIEVGLAVFGPESESLAADSPDQPTLAVLIPAHDEALGIGKTLEGLFAELRSPEQVLVIADNCTDDTAAIARATGARVVERFDPDQRGKGYALAYGLNQLQANPPEVVIVIDADCNLEPGALQLLARQACREQRPVQAKYFIGQSAATSLKGAISAFAIQVKNWVRPLGLQRLGAPCLLTGTGIALPWNVAMAVDVASGHIAEDMKWGLDLALAGYPPRFLATVQVTSQLPADTSAAQVQRTRWEHGHLKIMQAYLPRLLGQALGQRRLDLVALALELSILPLSLLVMVWAGVTGVMLAFAGVSPIRLPLYIALGAGAVLFTAVMLAWYRYGRSTLSLGQLILSPVYMLWKVPIYIAFLMRPEQRWVRTRRDR